MTKKLEIPYSQMAPQFVEAEEGLLSILLTCAKSIDLYAIVQLLEPDHFYRTRNKAIYEAIKLLVTDHYEADVISVSKKLNELGKAQQAESPLSLAEISAKVVGATNSHAMQYLAMIHEAFQRRELIVTANEIMTTAHDPSTSVDQIVGGVALDLEKIDAVIPRGESTESQLRKLEEFAEMVYKSQSETLGPAVTGIRKLDLILDGAYEGGVTLVAGDTGSGKSVVFNTILNHCVDLKIPVYSWSGEMDSKAQLSRLIAARTMINSRVIRRGGYLNPANFPDGKERWFAAREEIINAGHIFGGEDMGEVRIMNTIAQYARSGIKLFLFDRKELFETSGYDSEEGIGRIMNKIRRLASQLKIHIFVASQIRKEADKRAGNKPTKNDVIGTSATIQAATAVVLVYRPEYYGIQEDEQGLSTKGRVWLNVVKNTNGDTGEVATNFYKEISLMSEDESIKPQNGPAISFLEEPEQTTYNPLIETTKVDEDETIPF